MPKGIWFAKANHKIKAKKTKRLQIRGKYYLIKISKSLIRVNNVNNVIILYTIYYTYVLLLGGYLLEFVNIFLLIFAVLFVLSFSFFIYHQISNISETIEMLKQDQYEVFDKNELSSYELERLEREERFDDRINRLKEELANQQHVLHQPTIADELHPMVKNLPHNCINTKNDILPDVEISE